MSVPKLAEVTERLREAYRVLALDMPTDEQLEALAVGMLERWSDAAPYPDDVRERARELADHWPDV